MLRLMECRPLVHPISPILEAPVSHPLPHDMTVSAKAQALLKIWLRRHWKAAEFLLRATQHSPQIQRPGDGNDAPHLSTIAMGANKKRRKPEKTMEKHSQSIPLAMELFSTPCSLFLYNLKW